MSLASIFDDGEAMTAGDSQNFIKVGGETMDMDRNNRTGPRRNQLLDLAGIECKGTRVNVGEDRDTQGMQNGEG